MCTLVTRGGNLGFATVAPLAATLESPVTYVLRVCALCQVLYGVCPAVSGLVSGASNPCSVCLEICDCSSSALSIAGGGASPYQHLSGGEALWYTTCAPLALLALRLRFALHLFLFAAISCSHALFAQHGACSSSTAADLPGTTPSCLRLPSALVDAFLHHVVFCFPLAD